MDNYCCSTAIDPIEEISKKREDREKIPYPPESGKKNPAVLDVSNGPFLREALLWYQDVPCLLLLR
jgi:hypothetical protein